jgi:hypothetical protein
MDTLLSGSDLSGRSGKLRVGIISLRFMAQKAYRTLGLSAGDRGAKALKKAATKRGRLSLTVD